MEKITNQSRTCAKKVLPGNLPCGQLVKYVTATPPEVPHSGYYHVDRTVDADHLPVPKSWLA